MTGQKDIATKPVRVFPPTHALFQRMALSVSVGVGRRVTMAEVINACAQLGQARLEEVEALLAANNDD